MLRQDAIDLLQEVVRLERIANALKRHVKEHYSENRSMEYYLEKGDATTALDVLEHG